MAGSASDSVDPPGGSAQTVTLDVWRIARRQVPLALWHLAVDRRRLRRSPGVSFAKLLGTGQGTRFGAGAADLTRWAALTVWDGPEPVGTPVGRAWDQVAASRCRLLLRPVVSRGNWAGRSPFRGGPDSAEPGRRSPVTGSPVLVLTRARLRPSRALAFWRTTGPVEQALSRADGLFAAFGVGEAPLGFQGTVSIWRCPAAIARFAYREAEHVAAIAETRRLRWYAEELFARFDVLDIDGDRGVLGWRGSQT